MEYKVLLTKKKENENKKQKSELKKQKQKREGNKVKHERALFLSTKLLLRVPFKDKSFDSLPSKYPKMRGLP